MSTTTAQPEIRVHHASKGGVIDLVGSKSNVSIVTKNANITVHDANEEGEIKLDKTTNRIDIEMGQASNFTEFSAEGGTITGRDATFDGEVIQGSSTGAATDGESNSASIPSSTKTSTAEISGTTPSSKIRVKLKSTANKLTKHGEFEPDEKVSDKMEEIKALLGEKGEIQLYHEDGKTMVVVSKSFRENGIKTNGTIVVKAEVLCNTEAPPSQVRQIV